MTRGLEDRGARKPTDTRVRSVESEIGGTAVLLARHRSIIPAQTVVERQLARGLPGILPVERPLALAPTRVRRRILLNGAATTQQETGELVAHLLSAKTGRYCVRLSSRVDAEGQGHTRRR